MGIGLWEWVVIALIVLLVFGGSKLPKLGKDLGEGIRNFSKGLKEGTKEETEEKSIEKTDPQDKEKP